MPAPAIDEQANIMLARYYSSSLGRFMAVDPGDDTALEDPQSWNRFTYVRNNPINRHDPDGKVGVLGAVLGGAIDLGVQMIVENKSLNEVNWVSVGVSAAAGATGAGLGSVVGKAITKTALTTGAKMAAKAGLNAAGSAAIGATANVANTVGTNIKDGNSPTEGLTAEGVGKAAALSGALGGLGSVADDAIGATGKAIGDHIDANEVIFQNKPVYARGQTSAAVNGASVGAGNAVGTAISNSAPALKPEKEK
jgi:RHS repeat-associated protein